MAEITDPIVLNHLNAGVRVVNERVRAVMRQVADLLADYDANVATLISGAADADTLADGRESDGVPIRTVGELRKLILALRLLDQTAKYEGAADNTAHQTAFNNLAGASVHVPLHLTKFTVRTSLFN